MILLGCPSAPSLRPPWWPLHLQNGSPWWSHRAWGKEQSCTEQDQVNREVVPVRQCSSQPGTAGCSGQCEQVHCRGEAATFCPAITVVSYRALSKAKPQDLFVTLLIDHLALWQELTVVDAWHQRTWSTWLWLLILTILLSSASVTSETSTDSSGAWFPDRTQKSMSHHQWWLYKTSLVQFEDAQWCPDTPACGAPSDQHSAALAPFLCRLSAWEEV